MAHFEWQEDPVYRPGAEQHESVQAWVKFEGTGPEMGKTGAKPEIWQKPADFAAKVRDFQAASNALRQAAASGNMAAVKASYGKLGGTCKACHDSYRSEMH